jgi:hypothetical protein
MSIQIQDTNIFSIFVFMSLQWEIADYQENELRELHELKRFFQSLSFQAAVEYASSGVTPHRKIHPHQRGIGVKLLRRSATLLKKQLPLLRKARSFAHLFIITEACKSELKGLGDLWSYDTALRMAFNRGRSFYPQTVFVQRGVRKGVRKIFSEKSFKERTLPMKIFPKEMRSMKPFEAENFLCVLGRT